jgi:D-arabinan exo alpha-(1,3)/(1,5)-arabinofuranosidase (non-reducing end)
MKRLSATIAGVNPGRVYYLLLLVTACILAGSMSACTRWGTGGGTDARNLETFGTAGKAETLYPGREKLLFEHKGAGCLTHMWFGGSWPEYGRTRIRVYVDGETKPSIDMELFLGHGIGWDDSAGPWGTARLGKTGQPSGIYNTYRIPFSKSVRVTAELGAGVDQSHVFWWIVRGVENLPVYLGNIRLPSNARLRLEVHNNVALKPLEMANLAQSLGPGALYQVTLAVDSSNCNFLEAMMRAYVNGAKQPLMLSSGTEDYFLGTYYFNRGMYHLPLSGLTHMESAPGSCRVSAYRFHVEDPIIFQKGWRLVWRNGETQPDGTPDGSPQPSQMTSYAWFYQW